jgi:hypothetical protein
VKSGRSPRRPRRTMECTRHDGRPIVVFDAFH